jgi:hypothetical protein
MSSTKNSPDNDLESVEIGAYCWGKAVTLLRNNVTRFIFLVSSHRQCVTVVVQRNKINVLKKLFCSFIDSPDTKISFLCFNDH